MGFKCGIVGLPNVGKSTLFNALTQTAQAAAENYPFCTIEPNLGQVPVPDERMVKLAGLAGSKELIPTQLTFVDIAGLVRGAASGEGLGNKFLAHIREVDAIIQVIRCFEDDDITHVDGKIDPVSDIETIETELMLADLESLERRAETIVKKIRGGDKEAIQQSGLIDKALAVLREGMPARTVKLEEDDIQAFKNLQLLTSKPVLYVCNVEEDSAATGNAFSQRVAEKAAAENAGSVVISAAIEAEVAQLENEERTEFLADLGLEETGLSRIIQAGYELLDLVTYFTVGPKECRAWTITRGTKAPQAAGVIHTDFEKGFIRSETISYEAYVENDGESGSKEAGQMRLEGKEYVVLDGDVLHFRFAN
ncbi:redox-regulated ATPase YchF [Alphaproteobacteria bacterium 46_93_T64]|nr:redox-regulated ATPase YchF [Alphaproteobacteria bacterium 46_93_T64]